MGPEFPTPVTDTERDPAREGSGTSTHRLLRRVQQGDEQALDSLIDRVTAPLRRWAHRRLPTWVRDGTDTADLVQDALTRAFRHIGHFEPRGPRALQAYLRQCVRNRIVDEVRRAGRRPPTEALDGVDVAAPGSPWGDLIAAQDFERYSRCLGRLDEQERELIVGRLELGYNFRQLALLTGRTSPDAARMALRRALMRLAEEMGSA